MSVKYRRFGSASWNTNGTIRLFLNINSWPTMQLIRSYLSQWLPSLPMWESENHYVEKSYFRNNFRWDGEYIVTLPADSQLVVEALLLKPISKCR
jgi:hypothetical protein